MKIITDIDADKYNEIMVNAKNTPRNPVICTLGR